MCDQSGALRATSTSVNEAYKNAGKCLQNFVEEDDKYGFRAMTPICRDIVRLYDYIRFQVEGSLQRRRRVGKARENWCSGRNDQASSESVG